MTKLRKPRIACPHCGAVYVLEKAGGEAEGETTAGPEPQPEFRMLQPRTLDWYAAFFRLRARPGEDPHNSAPVGQPFRIVHRVAAAMLRDARSGQATPVKGFDGPSEAERAMPKIAVDSHAFRAWRQALDGEGYGGFGNDGAIYVWVPSEWPDDEMARMA